jgi:hypothetical protein
MLEDALAAVVILVMFGLMATVVAVGWGLFKLVVWSLRKTHWIH